MQWNMGIFFKKELVPNRYTENRKEHAVYFCSALFFILYFQAL